MLQLSDLLDKLEFLAKFELEAVLGGEEKLFEA